MEKKIGLLFHKNSTTWTLAPKKSIDVQNNVDSTGIATLTRSWRKALGPRMKIYYCWIA